MPEPTQSVVSQLDPTTPVVAASPDQPTVTPAAPMTTTPLSEDTRERTRVQFEKLIDSNKRLFESNQALMKEIQQRNQSTQTFAPIQNVPSTTNQPTRVNPQDFIETDPTTGESVVNVEKMKTHIAEINQKASRVEQAMESYIKSAESREIDRQNKEAFTTYPELNPKDEKTFNQSFNKQVRGVLIDSMYNADDYGGRPLTFKEAADFIKIQTQTQQPTPTTDEEKAKKEAEEAAKKAKELKQQGSTQVPSQPGNPPAPTNDAELQELRFKTRMGNTEALAKRLVNTPHILPKEAKEVS